MATDPRDPGTRDMFGIGAKPRHKQSRPLRDFIPATFAENTPVKRRLIEAAANPGERSPLGYMHTVMCQTSMPFRRPPADVRRWQRRNGVSVMEIEAGRAMNPQTKEMHELPLPSGAKARLVLMHINSEALRGGDKIIHVEDSMTAFMRSVLGFAPNGRNIRAMKTQLGALSAANIRIAMLDGCRAINRQTPVVAAFDIWFPRDSRQKTLWPSTIELSQPYFDSLTAHAVPLDMDHVRALSHSAMALDIYMWLAQRLHRVKSPVGDFVPWTALHEQFGAEYGRINNFRKNFRIALTQVRTVYREAQVGEEIDGRGIPNGLRLAQSRPPVLKRG